MFRERAQFAKQPFYFSIDDAEHECRKEKHKRRKRTQMLGISVRSVSREGIKPSAKDMTSFHNESIRSSILNDASYLCAKSFHDASYFHFFT